MKFTYLKSSFSLFCLLTALVALPRPAAAQFAVFDASNWAMMGKVWASDAATTVKMEQELQQGLKLYQNAVQVYGLASQEASYLKNKQILLAAGFLAQHALIPGQPGWDKALTSVGGIANAGIAWQQMTAPRSSLQSRIAMSDSFATAMLHSIGSCAAASTQNNDSLGKLELMAVDLNPSANTRANQANLANMSSAQQLRVQQCQQNVQLQQAKLQLLAAQEMRSRDQELRDRLGQTAVVMGQLKTTDTAAAINAVVDR